MRKIQLGQGDMQMSVLGLGCMGMSENYGPADDAQSVELLSRAVDRGISLFDTADSYGPCHNEELLGKFAAGRRERLIIATKFGFVRNAGPTAPAIDNSPQYIRQACEGSLQRLKVEAIDLYYVHRVDPRRPIEETVSTLADLVREGKIRSIGLSEVSAATLRRAAAVHPISAVQSEYSLWTRDVEREVLPACRELGVTFVAFAPLGRGFLTGAIPDAATLSVDDYRRQLPRFQGEAAALNLRLVRRVQAIAEPLGCTAAQLALAWLMSRPGVIPIPGSRRIERLDENVDACGLVLSPGVLAALESVFPPGAAAGPRYDAAGMSQVNA